MPEFPIIHSQQFKNWFGNSKIVDNNGNPLVVWHGLKNPEMYFDSKTKKYYLRPISMNSLLPTKLRLEHGSVLTNLLQDYTAHQPHFSFMRQIQFKKKAR